jgi:hypothetical protein
MKGKAPAGVAGVGAATLLRRVLLEFVCDES